MTIRTKPSGPQHENFYQDLVALVDKHSAHLGNDEMLAVASNMVGKLIAMQDQRTMTEHRAMLIVSENIQAGNRQAVDQLISGKGGHA
jgi:uncharacterized protein YejL (UPF0352 family)